MAGGHTSEDRIGGLLYLFLLAGVLSFFFTLSGANDTKLSEARSFDIDSENDKPDETLTFWVSPGQTVCFRKKGPEAVNSLWHANDVDLDVEAEGKRTFKIGVSPVGGQDHWGSEIRGGFSHIHFAGCFHVPKTFAVGMSVSGTIHGSIVYPGEATYEHYSDSSWSIDLPTTLNVVSETVAQEKRSNRLRPFEEDDRRMRIWMWASVAACILSLVGLVVLATRSPNTRIRKALPKSSGPTE